MARVGLFVDTGDLYHKVQRKFGRGVKVCYKSYYNLAKGDNEIVHAIAYGMQNENHSFINCLRTIGFLTRFKPPRVFNVGVRKIKKCDWNIAITLDIVSLIDDLDVVILGSSNNLFFPLVKWIRNQGVEARILASCIPRNLNEEADYVTEIDENLLEELEEV